MPARLSLTSVIVLGAWNPAILTPEWLAKYKVIEARPSEESVKLGMPEQRIMFATGDVNWTIDHTRFEVRAKQSIDCGQYAARILGLLPHTPVSSIGTNFIFRIPGNEWPKESWQMAGIDLGITDEDQVQWAVTRMEKDTRLQITINRLIGGDVNLAFNFHRNSDSTEVIAKYAAGWQKDGEVAVSLLTSRFNKKYEPDDR